MSLELKKRFISSLILLPTIILLIIEGSIFFNIFLFICFLISCYEWNSLSKNFFLLFIGLIFLCLSFVSIYLIRFSFGDNSLFYITFITTICISTDLGGYIFGKIFKGPKLTKISPNKTYSGVGGSFIFSILLTLSFFWFLIEYGYINISINLNLLTFILLISLISQIGDIIVSYFKRLSKIKDTGNIIPGHGGILDRIDGMLFAFPTSYLIFKFDIIL